MGFAVGENVGPYQISAYLGQGGMATIYKAHQLTLDRDVALKVIHPALKNDEAFLARLNREAAILAKLNHPNIVSVFDFGECDGLPYLVMRFIQGQTLKQILQAQKLSTERILETARAIGAALTYAHAHGVLHRDVKPSNILIDEEGNCYLTDFGLARLAHSSESTMSRDMLIGSPQYISPEQAKSEPVDERSDIYSFGAVLYEMFTHHVPFQGDTPYATIMAHINDPLPAPRALNPEIPLAVEQVLAKALAKDRAERYASISDMVTALENAVRGPQTVEDPNAVPIVLNPFQSGSPDSRTAPRTGIPHKRLALIAVGVLAVCLVAVCSMTFAALSKQFPFIALNQPAATSTRTIAASVLPTATPLAPTSTAPVASIAPATATPLRPIAIPTLASDSPRGKIAYSVATGERVEQHSVWIANANGSDARQIADSAIWPAFSPDGKQLAYVRLKSPDGVYVANSDGSGARLVVGSADTCCVQWSPDSKRLAYFRGNLKKSGSIFTASADGTNVAELTVGFNPAWSPDGNRLAYTSCHPTTNQCGLFLFDVRTKTSTIITRDNGANPQWSPRGDKIVYQADDGKGHINVFVVNADGTGVKQLTTGKNNDGQPTWSRDGSFVFWRSDQNGAGWAIFVMRADGSNPRLLINNTPASISWGRESLSTAP
ncbi:MAG: protein kinase [Chloroflexi bacterium]|nr:protein kinase [Chloroflexota bacterium]